MLKRKCDKMSVDLNIHFQQGIDSIVGFEDYNDKKRALLADNANVLSNILNCCYYHNFRFYIL